MAIAVDRPRTRPGGRHAEFSAWGSMRSAM